MSFSSIDQIQSLLKEIENRFHDFPSESRDRISTGLESFARQMTNWLRENREQSASGEARQRITEQKPVEEALRESVHRERARVAELQALMDAVPAMIWISRDPQCREMIGNRYGYEFLKMWEGANISKTAPEEDRERQPYRNFKNGREIPNDELPMQVAASTGVGTSNYEFDLVFNNGTVKNLFGNVLPLSDENGKPAGAVAAFVDISKRKQLEAVQRENEVQIAAQRHLLDVREDERINIAREIHDGPLQTLMGIVLTTNMLEQHSSNPAMKAQLMSFESSLRHAIQELRQVINELRPPDLTGLGLAKAIREQAQEVQEKFPGLEITTDLHEEAGVSSDKLNLTLYRICQEALRNVIRHSKATKVEIRLLPNHDHVILTIKDNGIGFALARDFTELIANKHYGLTGMKERAEALGGTLQVISQPGEGTKIKVYIPYS